MTALSEISAAWIAYRDACRYAERYPLVLAYQFLAARAYAVVVCLQAQYFGEVRV